MPAAPEPTDTVAPAPGAGLARVRAGLWTLWIAVVLGGFLWQFGWMAAGLLRR